MITSRRDFLKLAGLSVPAAALASCADAPPMQQFPQLSYSHLGRFTFEAQRIEIAQE